MNRPNYLEQVLIRCIECRTVVKCNGEAVQQHTELLHRHSRGEKSAICRQCWANREKRERYVGTGESWTAGAAVVPKL